MSAPKDTANTLSASTTDGSGSGNERDDLNTLVLPDPTYSPGARNPPFVIAVQARPSLKQSSTGTKSRID